MFSLNFRSLAEALPEENQEIVFLDTRFFYGIEFQYGTFETQWEETDEGGPTGLCFMAPPSGKEEFPSRLKYILDPNLSIYADNSRLHEVFWIPCDEVDEAMTKATE